MRSSSPLQPGREPTSRESLAHHRTRRRPGLPHLPRLRAGTTAGLNIVVGGKEAGKATLLRATSLGLTRSSRRPRGRRAAQTPTGSTIAGVRPLRRGRRQGSRAVQPYRDRRGRVRERAPPHAVTTGDGAAAGRRPALGALGLQIATTGARSRRSRCVHAVRPYKRRSVTCAWVGVHRGLPPTCP